MNGTAELDFTITEVTQLPEFHLPGHNFTGPGTRLQERLARGDQPINRVDRISMEHDMQYAAGVNETAADIRYVRKALGIVLNRKASPRERAEAVFVGSVIGAKAVLEGVFDLDLR